MLRLMSILVSSAAKRQEMRGVYSTHCLPSQAASCDDQEDWKAGRSFCGITGVLVSKQPALKGMGLRAGIPAKMVTGVALVQQHEHVPGGRSALVPDRQNLSGCSNTHGVAKAGETDRLTLNTDKSSPDERAFSRTLLQSPNREG